MGHLKIDIVKARHFLAVSLFLFLTATVYAQSQGPTPTERAIVGHKAQDKSSEKHKEGNTSHQGTENHPFFVKIVNPQMNENGPNSTAQKKNQNASNSHFLLWFYGLFNELPFTDIMLVVFNGLLVFFTARLYHSTRGLWRSAEKQSKDLKLSAEASVRFADAMEKVAKAMEETSNTNKEISWRQQRFMRAHLSVTPRGWVKQNRETVYPYEISMLVKNSGNTPAYNVTTTIRLDVFAHPLPEDIDLSLPPTLDIKMSIAAHSQDTFITGRLNRLLSDEEIEQITKGATPKLYAFGEVHYDDVFGETHYTNFCRWAAWDTNWNITMFNAPRHNEAT